MRRRRLGVGVRQVASEQVSKWQVMSPALGENLESRVCFFMGHGLAQIDTDFFRVGESAGE